MIEPRSRGVLDPRLRGDDSGVCVAITCLTSIPRDDLALVPMNGLGIGQVPAPAAEQKFRAAGADRVVAATPGGRLAVVIFRQERQREDVAPHLPRGG